LADRFGFEYFYGFVAGETNQWYPAIHEGTKIVDPPKTPGEGYHFLGDMTDRAIGWVSPAAPARGRQAILHVFCTRRYARTASCPKEWADKYKGKFDQGWDKLREETLARQKKLGVIPKRLRLTVRPQDIPAWTLKRPETQALLAREMEVYAGFLEFC